MKAEMIGIQNRVGQAPGSDALQRENEELRERLRHLQLEAVGHTPDNREEVLRLKEMNVEKEGVILELERKMNARREEI